MKIEKRTFVNSDKYDDLVNFFDKNSKKTELEKQIIYFYNSDNDFRIIKTKKYIKMDLKPDNIEEDKKVVFIAKEYEQNLIDIFFNLGMSIKFKRYRIRHKYIYNDLYITLDKNIKFGNVLRISPTLPVEKEELNYLVQNLYNELEIEESSMETFHELYAKYRLEWADLTKEINEEQFLNE